MAACSNAQSTAKGGGLIENADFFDSIGHSRPFRVPTRPVYPQLLINWVIATEHCGRDD
jgi:hypothetical protein